MTDWPRVQDAPRPPRSTRQELVLPRWARILLVALGVWIGLVSIIVLVVFSIGRANDAKQREAIAEQAHATAQANYEQCLSRQRSAQESLSTYDQLLLRARPDLDPAIRDLIVSARAAAARGAVIGCQPPPSA